jgi:CcmD family protein
MAYLFAAYLVLWGIAFGYLLFLGARQRKLQRELEILQRQRSRSPGDKDDDGDANEP